MTSREIFSLLFDLGLTVIPLAFATQYSTKYFANFKPSFCSIFIVVLVCVGLSMITGFIFNLINSQPPNQFSKQNLALPFLVGLIIQTLAYAKLIKHPIAGAIGLNKACLVTLGAILLVAAFYILLTVVVLLCFSISKLFF